jgi:hypothetical protein
VWRVCRGWLRAPAKIEGEEARSHYSTDLSPFRSSTCKPCGGPELGSYGGAVRVRHFLDMVSRQVDHGRSHVCRICTTLVQRRRPWASVSERCRSSFANNSCIPATLGRPGLSRSSNFTSAAGALPACRPVTNYCYRTIEFRGPK